MRTDVINRHLLLAITLLVLTALLTDCAPAKPPTAPLATQMTSATKPTTAPLFKLVRPTGPNPPSAPREFRATWVASVNNGNWPSKRGLSVEQQKNEMLAILDRAVALNLNAVVFQVR